MDIRRSYSRALRTALALVITTSCAARTHPQESCTADRPCEAETIPRCAAGPESLAFDELYASREQHVGQTVRVRGVLTRAGNVCTRRACLGERPCCNRCEGRVVLAASASGPLSYPMPPHLPLGAPPDTRWQCVGDETGQCCSIALDGQSVIVQATLRRGPGEVLMLDEAQVCSP